MITGNETIGERIARLRTEKGATQIEMAAALYVDRVTVSQWENGARDIKTRNTVSLAEYFGVSCDYLLGRSRIAAPDDFIQTACNRLGLQESVIETLELYGEVAAHNAGWNAFWDDSQPLPLSTTELGLKALSHIIANCNALLTGIGLYLFGNFTGLENVKVEGVAIGPDKPGEFMCDAMLATITTTLANYRTQLVDNGFDLPLNRVIKETREDRWEQIVNQRVEFLESVRGRPLTEAEIQQQRDLWEQSQRRTDKELMVGLFCGLAGYIGPRVLNVFVQFAEEKTGLELDGNTDKEEQQQEPKG